MTATRTALDISVLYVEDEEVTRQEIHALLVRRVRDVLVAQDGSEGLALYSTLRPDLVVTDIRMPVMDGLAMAREIRALDREARIIVTSAHSDTSYLLQAIDLGIDGYVMKPVDTTRLSAMLGRCAEVIEYRRQSIRHQEERDRSLEELKTALAKLKQLSGFLPICASCKKIRDDRGYWQQIEAYIRDHSEAEFTHSVCPDCAQRLYGDFTKKQNQP